MKKSNYWRNLIVFASGALLVGVAAVIVAYTYQAALGYPHPSRVFLSVDDTPAKFGIAYQDVTITTSDGLKLSAWYTPSKNGAVILVAHGYHGARDLNMHVFFAKHGYGAVTWDFRAHGKSEGDLSTIGYYEVRDVEAALDFALAQPDVKKVGGWGGSMGGAATIMAAAKRNEISAVVADSAFATLEGQLETMVKVAALRPLVRFFAEREAGMSVEMVRPVDHIARLSPRPILIIQGLADDSIPIQSAQRLYDAALEPKLLWQELNVGHVGMRTVYPEQYEKKVFAFFDSALLK
jgi:fermentation-respiration switch protein FrsA (DUF1100 family)